jgi:LPXTG-motif cell wall-anchored protein
MKTPKLLLILATFLFSAAASAQQESALTCADFRPTPEALERYPNLAGACESIIERDGELYGLFRADVRRVRGNNVTLHLPVTGKTFVVRPDTAHRVIADGQKLRARNLSRGQEIRIYLPVSEFAELNVDEIAFITEEDFIVEVQIEEVPALPTTASPWPTVAFAGLLLLGAGYLLRRRRLSAGAPLVVLLGVALMAGAPSADADSHERTVQIPGKVITSTVRSVAIVEAVDRETREIRVIDSGGNRYSFIASDMVANFDQIEPRDRIVTDYLESVAIFVTPADAPTLPDAGAIEVAPLGEKPGFAVADTFMVSATIESLNTTDRIATLRGEDGRTRTVKISDNVPLDMVEVGDEVRMRITEAIAISVVEPDQD